MFIEQPERLNGIEIHDGWLGFMASAKSASWQGEHVHVHILYYHNHRTEKGGREKRVSMKISKGGKKNHQRVSQEKAEEINGPDGEMIPYRASLHDHAIVCCPASRRCCCAARLFFFKSLFDSLHCHWTTTKVDPIQVSLCCHLFKTSFYLLSPSPFSKAWKSKLWRRVFSPLDPLSHSLSDCLPSIWSETLVLVRWFVGSSASAIRTFAAVASV